MKSRLIRLRDRFFDLGIKKKLLITNVGIICIMIMMLGFAGYFLVQRLLSEQAVAASVSLLEQMGDNYDYQISTLGDFVLSQSFDSDLNQYLLKDKEAMSSRERYDANSYFSAFSYNLMNYNSYIKFVMLTDSYGNSSLYAYNLPEVSLDLIVSRVNFEKVQNMRGGNYWQPLKEDIILASRSLFDKNSMREMGSITIGVDSAYFKKHEEKMGDELTSKIIMLNSENEILMQSDEESGKAAGLIVEKYNPQVNTRMQIYYQERPYIFVTWKSHANEVWIMNLIDKGKIAGEVTKALRPLIYIAICAVVFTGMLALYISGGIAETVYQLLDRTKGIAKGDFSTQIQPRFHDEIGTLALSFNEMSRRIRELIETVSEEKTKQKNVELKALQFEYDSLQSKINPHFLYNTLESINSLAKLRGEEEIAESIYLLGNYLRETISNKSKFVLFEEELANIRDYIKIQKVSYREKINIEFEVEEALLDAVVPKLILQPLVENAIVHGIEPKLEPGLIAVKVRCQGKDMVIDIIDDGVGIEKSRLKDGLLVMDGAAEDKISGHTKVGVMSVHKRIQILYGQNYGLRIESEPARGTHIRLNMPIRFEGEMDDDI